MERIIIVLTGLPGSGKSEVSREVARKGIPTFHTGNIIKEEVAKRGLELTLESSEFIARELRAQYGPDAPIKLMEHHIKESKGSLVCVVGPRNLKEVELLSTLGRIVLIIVDSPKRTRYSRLRKRAEPRDPEKWEEFLWRDRRELERGMKSLISTKKYTRFIIRNSGTIADLRRSASKVLGGIMSPKAKRKK
jgi:dephospho-CoA kinase